MNKTIKLNVLALSICLAQQAYALQPISDRSLSQVTGQDGISITHEVSKVTIDQLNWVDYHNTGSMKLGMHDIEVLSSGGQNIKSTLDVDVGTTANGVGMHIQASISPFKSTVQNIMLICEPNCGDNQTDQNLGSLSFHTISPLRFNLITSNGLFNRNDLAHLDFELKNASISYGLNGQNLTLKDFNFNLSADGYMYLDQDEGIVLATKNSPTGQDHIVNLGRVEDLTNVSDNRSGATNPGVNIDLRYGPEGSQNNLIRMGASGAVTNGKLFINANQAGIGKFNTVSRNSGDLTETTRQAGGYDIAGPGGLHLGMSAEFTREGNPLLNGRAPTTLEIGHTGTGSYAIEFSNLSPLAVRDSNNVDDLTKRNAYIDFGDIFINTVQAKSLNFIINENMQKVLGSNTLELIYNISPDQNAQNLALIAVRGMDFQAIARKARFISDNSINAITATSGEWGIGIPIFNLNTNLALYAKNYSRNGIDRSGLGYNLALSTEGYGIDQKTGAPSTTSILIIDGATGKYSGEEVNYYAGLRNIDAYLKSDGVIGFEEDGIYVKADNLLLAAKAEIAIGQLPGSLYNCAEVECQNRVVPIDNFARKDDILASLAFKLDGKGELMIIPGLESTNATPDTNFLSLKANFEFNPIAETDKDDPSVLGSYISLINEDWNGVGTKTSSVNLNKMQGHVGLDARVLVKQDTVVLDNQVNFNYKATMQPGLGQAFKAEMAMSPSGTMQKIADFAIPGGNMRSTLGITPR
ncbi:DUF6160 family protein [Acinetobacter indicus]|uniref:DUF6160 family protein n=1 Tax=Acinetobacter indicus TaxID=756892 RepID=UPI00257902ED|nr:DUF6160 family protein [Acinetobacter indicus]MDM1770803.1 hypothetical protein [Acinetobacter indicus]MDM1773671.1 hypothetical protein [Acinetobacter indicus]